LEKLSHILLIAELYIGGSILLIIQAMDNNARIMKELKELQEAAKNAGNQKSV